LAAFQGLECDADPVLFDDPPRADLGAAAP
jgi:hypothetical protein